jgi:two-component system sensor histidine kinase YcbA
MSENHKSINWKMALLTGVIVALLSELHLSMFVTGFRVSASVIAFPVLLLTVCRGSSGLVSAVVTSVLVFVIRLALGAVSGTASLGTVFPGAFFYFTYGAIFMLVEGRPEDENLARTLFSAFAADLVSNIFEVMLREQILGIADMNQATIMQLTGIALARAVIAVLILAIIRSRRKAAAA